MSKQKTTPEKRSAGNGTPAKGDGVERLAAYFLSLSLENVRCFGPKQTLDLSDGHGKPARWTIILGVNGTGKTTILQSLVGFELIRLPSTNSKGLEEFGARYFGLPTGTGASFRRSGLPSSTLMETTIACSSQLTASPMQIGYIKCEMPADSKMMHDERSFPRNILYTPWCCAYGAGRRVGVASLSEPGTGGDNDPTATLFSDRAELRNPEEWLLQLDYAAATVKPNGVRLRYHRRLEQVKELLLRVMLEGEVEAIRLTVLDSTHPTGRAEFKTPYGWVPLRQLGYGYQALITWVTDLVSRMAERYPDSPDPLAEPAVVLVDEIDLHLHPVWQRKLMGFLTERFPNTQFIATAHSPLVAQAAADANLAVLRREGDHVVIENDVDDIRNWRIDQILTSDLFGLPTARPPQIEPLLLERKALLTKPKLTRADEKRLKELEAEIGELPTGETAQEAKERELVRKALDHLSNRAPSR
jgi:putative AbiEii toxin of type IV toxin-antitoxin system